MIKRKTFLLGFVFASFIGSLVGIAWHQYHSSPESNAATPTHYTPSFTRYAPSYTLDSTSVIVPEGLNFIYAAKVTIPSVVHVQSQDAGQGGAHSLWKYFSPSQQRQFQRIGSGVIISSDGYIVTNHHVVKDAVDIEVTLSDNRSYEAKTVGRDPTTDLALLKIDAEGLHPIQMGDSDKLEIGEWVLAVGNPFEFRSTVTAGIVSAKARSLNVISDPNNLGIESFIQTDAAVNHGNSGGALVNLRGELVGINTVIFTHTDTYTGYSFAVPISLVQKVAEDLKLHGKVQRALLGVNIVSVDAKLAKLRDLRILRGVMIGAVHAGSAAEQAGLRRGDVMVSVDDVPVSNTSELQELIARHRPGDHVVIAYVRDNDEHTVRVKLQSAPLAQTSPLEEEDSDSPNVFQGLVLRDLSEEEKKTYEVHQGVQIVDIRDSRWRDRGVRKGFVITHIDKKQVLSTSQALRLLREARVKGQVFIEGKYAHGGEAYYGFSW